MLIGHLPAGYLLTRALMKKYKIPLNHWWLGLGLLFSIAPDFDHIFNLLFQNNIYNHRLLPTHVPLTYLIILLIGLLIYRIKPWLWLKWGMIIALPNLILHLILDTPFVGIKWIWPFYPKLVGIYNVNITAGIIVPNYYHYWYWYLEIILWLAAVITVIKSYKKGELN